MCIRDRNEAAPAAVDPAAERGKLEAEAAVDAANVAPAPTELPATDAAEARGAADAEAAVAAAEPSPDAAADGAEARGSADAVAAVASAETTPAAALLPASGLKPDTLLAARAKADDIGYLGVWAADPAACGTVDQASGSGYVVITRISVRQGAEIALVDAVPTVDGKASLKSGESTIEIVQSGPDAISVNGSALLRCVLP